MNRNLSVLGFVVFVAAVAAGDSIPTSSGDIEITPIFHGSVQIAFEGQVIHVDPWGNGDYSDAAKAHVILVTDIHGDHLDPEQIEALRQEDTVLVVPAAAADQVEGEIVIGNGETKTIGGFTLEAVPMYNLKRGPEAGKLFHDIGRGNGYVLTLGNKRLYFSGDTECVPEMRALEDIDVAFVTMNLPYTMPPSEAAACVRAFAPKIVYPYHYRGSDLDEFVAALKDKPEIEVRLREWYPGQ